MWYKVHPGIHCVAAYFYGTVKLEFSLSAGEQLKKPAILRSELSTFGGKWVKLKSEGLKLLIALNCQATYFYIRAQSTLKLKYENPAVKLFLSCKC